MKKQFNYNNKWNKETYDDFISFLNSISEDKYRDFSKRITYTNKEILGIRLPILRNIAKNIKKNDYKTFLKMDSRNIFEIDMIKVYIIGSIKELDEYMIYFDDLINTIDNWALCDTFIASSKLIKNNKEYFFNISSKLIKTNDEFKNRVGLVILLNYFIDECYLPKICELLKDYNTSEYYAEMAYAWLVSYMYISDSKLTIEFMNNSKMSENIKKMAIRKIKDSYKVSKIDKDNLKSVVNL